MERKYQTRASKAEQQILELLKNEKNIIKPWGLVSYQAKNRTLQTAASEVAIILNNHANMRPGFEADQNHVYVPNLFVKICGRDEDLNTLYDIDAMSKRDNCFIYSSFQKFCPMQNQNLSTEALLDERGNIDRDQLLQSDLFPYSFLRKEYRDLYIDKINECLDEKDSLFTSRFDFVNKAFMLSSMLSIDTTLIEAFNRFDFQFQPPAVIIQPERKEKVNPYQGTQLLLLNKLGFDIVILSPDGYADIENIINPEYYSIFYGNNESLPRRKRKFLYYRIAGAALLIGTAILVKSLFLPAAQPNRPETVPSGDDTAIQTEVETNEEVPVPLRIDPVNIVETPETGNAVVPGEALTFQDRVLEEMIQMLRSKKEMPLFQADADFFTTLFITGPYAGEREMRFTTAYGEFGYYDREGEMHSEEGMIQTLADLKHFSRLDDLSVEWQNQLDTSALKDLTSLRLLSLCHDHLENIESLSELTDLTRLNLSYNRISDISPLKGMKRLDGLDLQYNNIEDISVLSNFKDLKVLVLASNPIRDASVIKQLDILEMLVLSDTPIRDFSFLKEMNNLESLCLDRTGFSDLNLIRHLKRLEFLVINDTKITDISILKEFPNLKSVHLKGLQLQDDSVLQELEGVEIIR